MRAIKTTIKVGALLFLANLLPSIHASGQSDPRQVRKENFKGVIELDVRNSKADWDPYVLKKAPAGAPNVLFILFDDTGQAAWSPYGGSINMPTLQKLADNGLIYSQWHTTALCS